MTSPKDLAGSKKSPIKHVPPSIMVHLAGPMKQGADKYGHMNWRSEPISLMGHVEGVLRHILAALDGEDVNLDSGYLHWEHAAAGLAIVLDAKDSGTLIDDRVAGPSGRLLYGGEGRESEQEGNRRVHVETVDGQRYPLPPEDSLPLDREKKVHYPECPSAKEETGECWCPMLSRT